VTFEQQVESAPTKGEHSHPVPGSFRVVEKRDRMVEKRN
jgi:hypothetical protein